MQKKRIIARLDVKNEFVIKGIHLEGLRKIGDPNLLAKKYYESGADEIIIMDAVASLYGRNGLFQIIERACQEVFIPITIGGGIRKIDDIEKALFAGADKIAINTEAILNPNFISEATRIYGSQCIIGSIEAKKRGDKWEAYINNGREETSIDAIEWARKLEGLGAGEIFITSIDNEGTKKGFDIELIKIISKLVGIPVIGCGGAGSVSDISKAFKETNCSGLAVASVLHYNLVEIKDIKSHLNNEEILVRK